MFLKIPTFKTPSLHAQHQPYLEGGRLLFCCGVTFLGDSTSLVLSRLSRLALLMWVCRILVALSWNGLGRFVNIMDSSGAFRLNRSISTNWAALKLKHEENELLLATTNFYLKSWSSYYTLTLMTIESSLHISRNFCIFCSSSCYWWWWWWWCCISKTYLPDFHTFGFCREVDDAWQHKPRVGRVDKVCIIHH